jgi:hypothetical protein
MNDAFERRDSLRRYAPVKLTPPDGGAVVENKGVVSLRGVFLEGATALPASWVNALIGVEADLGSPKPMRSVCLVTSSAESRGAGFLLTWKTLDFEAERELARYLDEKPKS